jgi:O-antigen ligase
MCFFFIVLLLISSKFNGLPRIYFGVKHQRSNAKDTSTEFILSETEGLSVTNPLVSNIQYPEDHRTGDSDSRPVFTLFRRGKQAGMTVAKIDIKHLPSPIILLPFLLFLLPGLWFLLTSLWSSYPEVSSARALYFILISTGCISAGVLWLRYSGKGILDFLLPANILIVLLCLFSIITNIPSDSWTGGHGKGFIGFFGHQNLLASVLLFTLLALFGKIKDKSQKIKVFFFLILSLNLLVLALTYSRSAILSFIFGGILFLLLNKNWKIISYSFITAAVLTAIIYLTPSLNQFADKIIKKDFPEVYSSRMWMWEPSYKAALEGGLFGLGYGISHPDIRSGEYSDHFENGRLIREKGNSTLALIEETGLIGLMLFLIPIFYILFKLIYTKDTLLPTPNSQLPTCLPVGKATHNLLTAALAAFILHSQFEAWWVGVGSVQLPLFFIYLGLIFHFNRS